MDTPRQINPFLATPSRTQSPAMRLQDMLPALRENVLLRSGSPLNRESSRAVEFGEDDEGEWFEQSEVMVKKPVLSSSTSSKSLHRALVPNTSPRPALDPYTTNQDLDKFAQIFERTPELYALHDTEGLAPLYMGVCEETARRLSEVEATEPVGFGRQRQAIELELWEEERNTWVLIQRLYTRRKENANEASDQIVPDVDLMYVSDQYFVNHIIKNDKDLSEISVVKDWLQDIAPSFQPVETRKGYWFYTQRSTKDGRALTYFQQPGSPTQTVTELDPDAPTRQARQLRSEDAAYDRGLVKTVFEYLRRGMIMDATELCRASDQPWRAASIWGSLYFADPALDPDGSMSADQPRPCGNQNRSLWKGTCYQLAKEPSFDPYERALYAVLAGDVENLLPVCRTWEDYVWSHYCALIESRIERRMKMRLKDVSTELPIPTAYDDLSTTAVFANAYKYETEMKRGHEDHFHYIQSMIILDRTDDLIKEMKRRLVDEKWDSRFAGASVRQHLLRFMAHFVGFLKPIDVKVPDDSADAIMQAYVELLVESKKNRLVALYTSKLPHDSRIETFAAFLQTIEDPKPARWEYVAIAHQFGLEVRPILSRTVQRIFEEGMINNGIQPESSERSSKTTANDQKIIRALEWLTFQQQQYEDALYQGNLVQRKFLMRRNLSSAYHACVTLPDDILGTEWKDQLDGESPRSRAVIEHLHYRLLYRSNISFNEWSECFSRKPVESNKSLARHQLLEWNTAIKTRTKRCEEHLRELISTDWLKCYSHTENDFEDERRNDELLYIRRSYIPELVMELHTILYETRDIMPGNLEKSLEIANMVADETKKLYVEFVHAQKMPQLLSILRLSQVHALG